MSGLARNFTSCRGTPVDRAGVSSLAPYCARRRVASAALRPFDSAARSGGAVVAVVAVVRLPMVEACASSTLRVGVCGLLHLGERGSDLLVTCLREVLVPKPNAIERLGLEQAKTSVR